MTATMSVSLFLAVMFHIRCFLVNKYTLLLGETNVCNSFYNELLQLQMDVSSSISFTVRSESLSILSSSSIYLGFTEKYPNILLPSVRKLWVMLKWLFSW